MDCDFYPTKSGYVAMDISVVLCTYNRCEMLAKALSSLALSEVPQPLTWEVIVVDNNSSDDTRKVVEELQARYPDRFRYEFEPSQGKSYALNTGIRKATGKVLAFIDDDVVAETSWLAKLTADILAEKCSGTGGKILLEKSFVAPDWLPVSGPYSLAGMLAVFDLGEQPMVLTRPPFGTNMAFHRSMFTKYGLFRTDMGPSPGSEIRNEDVEFCRRLMTGGENLRYQPKAVVYHAVPARRRTQEYFLRFWFDHGRTSVRECGVRPAIAGIPRRYFTTAKILFCSGPVALLRWAAARDQKISFYHKGWLWMLAGEATELLRTPELGSARLSHPSVGGTSSEAAPEVQA